MKQTVFIIIAAYILDLIIGDPRWLPHPVKILGWIIKKLEPPVRRIIPNRRLAGIIFFCIITGFTAVISFFIIHKATMFNEYFGMIISILFVYWIISVKDLKDETMAVYRDFNKGDISSARKSLSMVVGRDTMDLNEGEIVRATVETIAEATNDGIIAPLFYLVLGGPVLGVVYKTVNTLDSMIGYKNERYKNFGWFSARIDDIANFIPARISGFLISLSSFILTGNFKNSFNTLLKYGRNHPSPNSGISEAAMAGALGIRLGGSSFYQGALVDKPHIGKDTRQTGICHIREALAISFTASILMVVMGAVFIWMVWK